MEKAVAVTKGELNVFNHERMTLKETLDTAKSERLAALDQLDKMKLRVDRDPGRQIFTCVYKWR